MSTLTFTVLGPPVAWARSRHQGSRHFTPAKQKAHGKLIALEALAARPPGWEPLDGLVQLGVVACFKSVKACYGTTEKPGHHRHPTPRRFDHDNLLKQVSDALNGIAYVDDGLVVEAMIIKTCGPRPFTRITVRSL